MLLSEVWELYKTDKQLEGYSPHTLKSYELQNNLFIRYQGNIPIADVTYQMIKSYLAEAAKTLKPASISFRMKYFRSLWRYAIDEGLISENPASRLRDPKQPRRIPKDMDPEQIEMLRMACETPLENALLETFFASGCRIGEVYQANKNIVNWSERTMTIIGKGDKERTVFFDVRCAIWLKRYLNDRDDTNMALFVTERRYKTEGNQPRRMSKDQMRWVLNRIAKRAGIENVYPHRLRHTFAMHLLRNGAPLEVIQQFMGHASLETTRIYSDYNTEMKKQLYTKYF